MDVRHMIRTCNNLWIVVLLFIFLVPEVAETRKGSRKQKTTTTKGPAESAENSSQSTSSLARSDEPPQQASTVKKEKGGTSKSAQDDVSDQTQPDVLETVVCPTLTQTVYLRPKTQTKTVHMLRSRAPAAEIPTDASGQTYDYVKNPKDENADDDDYSDSSTAGGDGVGPSKDISASQCAKPTTKTEFRSFVYLSTQFVYTTVTEYPGGRPSEYGPPPETHTVSTTIYPEPVTRFQTVTVVELQPSKDYSKQASQQTPEAFPENLPLSVVSTATVTVTAKQDCPILSCADTLVTSSVEITTTPTSAEINPTPRKRCRYPSAKGQQFRVISNAYSSADDQSVDSATKRWKRATEDSEDPFMKILNEQNLRVAHSKIPIPFRDLAALETREYAQPVHPLTRKEITQERALEKSPAQPIHQLTEDETARETALEQSPAHLILPRKPKHPPAESYAAHDIRPTRKPSRTAELDTSGDAPAFDKIADPSDDTTDSSTTASRERPRKKIVQRDYDDGYDNQPKTKRKTSAQNDQNLPISYSERPPNKSRRSRQRQEDVRRQNLEADGSFDQEAPSITGEYERMSSPKRTASRNSQRTKGDTASRNDEGDFQQIQSSKRSGYSAANRRNSAADSDLLYHPQAKNSLFNKKHNADNQYSPARHLGKKGQDDLENNSGHFIEVYC